MFGVGHDPQAGNAIDNSSLLYSNHDDLLDGSLLTPDSPSKFDLKASKADNTPFGVFDHLGIYDHYNDSGPPSIHFGDGNDTSEHGESHGSAKDEVSALTPALTDLHGKDMSSQSPLPFPNQLKPQVSANNFIRNMSYASNSTDLNRISPIQQQLLEGTPTTDGHASAHLLMSTRFVYLSILGPNDDC
jgi:hypothetical protein